MSHSLLLALFSDVTSAAAAARAAHALGVDRADLSVVARDHQDEGRIANQIDASPGSEIEDSPGASRLGELSGYILAAIAIGHGLTSAILNPLHPEVRSAVMAADVLTGHDTNCATWIASHRGRGGDGAGREGGRRRGGRRARVGS